MAPLVLRVYSVDEMEIGVIGLTSSGKTTLFNAITGGHAEVGTYGSSRAEVHVGISRVRDNRLDTLKHIFKPQKTVPIDIKFWDIPADSQSPNQESGIGGQFLNLLQSAHTILHVTRDFEAPSVPHKLGSIDAHRDIKTMNNELIISDLVILDRRMERLKEGFKGAKSAEREYLLNEQAILNQAQKSLEDSIPLREAQFSKQQQRVLSNYQFLTAKPMMLVLNTDENKIKDLEDTEIALVRRYQRQGVDVAMLCGQLEMELSELSPQEEAEFRNSLGMEQEHLQRLLQKCLSLLGRVTFFTFASEEVRAWSVRKETLAAKAAGTIHSDMERGFIRAEVIGFDDLVQCGSMTEGKKLGIVRLEGKNYAVQDGDVITFLFNV